MPRGPITYTGRYPGYEPAQAMEAFFSASGQHDRPSYEERRDVWVSGGDGYALVVGCFVEPDRTPVIAWTYVPEAAGSHPPHELFTGEVFSVLEPSAESIRAVLGDEDITESGAFGTTLRQLRPSEIRGSTPNRMKEEFIWPALNHAFPGQWEEFWPDYAAGVVSEGVGVVVGYLEDRFRVVTIVLSNLQISTELLEGIREANATLPIGSVFLSSVEGSWCAIWTFKLLGDWLDPSSRVSRQMAHDVLTNAPNMTQMAAEILQAKKCGGSPFTIEPDSEVASWAFAPISHV